jgi:hypothetical protein
MVSKRLSPRDALRAEWQYRLALAHFMLKQYEQASDWGHMAQANNSELLWPPIHAAALARLGSKAQAKGVLNNFLLRHPNYDTRHITQRIDGTDQRLLESRERLIASLREIGMR